MPIYQYKAKDPQGCAYCRDGFETMQSMKEPELTHCPKCGAPVGKVPARFSGFTPMLSDGNLKDKGFTKYKKRGDGSYEKM